jgi:hypothetical protein
LVGPSRSGKTQFLYDILKQGEKKISLSRYKLKWFKKIYYIFQFQQEIFKEIEKNVPGIVFVKLEDINFSQLLKGAEHCCLIFDDLIYDLTDQKYFLQIAIGEAHHSRFSVFIISQSLFPPGKYTRDITNQCSYTFVFKICNDLTSVRRFAWKVTPDNESYFMASYIHCTSKNYSPLLVDCEQITPRFLKLRGNFLGDIQNLYPAL